MIFTLAMKHFHIKKEFAYLKQKILIHNLVSDMLSKEKMDQL
jgi:hypothetical protein